MNAYTAGRRSVALTSRVVDDFLAGHSSPEMVHAVLIHVLGHLPTGGTRFSLVTHWLAAPCCGASSRRSSGSVSARVLARHPQVGSGVDALLAATADHLAASVADAR